MVHCDLNHGIGCCCCFVGLLKSDPIHHRQITGSDSVSTSLLIRSSFVGNRMEYKGAASDGAVVLAMIRGGGQRVAKAAEGD